MKFHFADLFSFRWLFRWLLCLVLIYAAVVIYANTFGIGLSLSAMDWNGDEHTSLGEFFNTMNIGVSPEEVNGVSCRRVYELKDGSTIKYLCP